MIKISRNKKLFIIFLIVIFICITFLYIFYSKYNAINRIKKKIGLELPDSSKIVFYDYTFIGDFIDVKIKIPKEHINDIIKQFKDDSKFPILNKDNSKLNISNFENTSEWFLINDDNLKYLFNSYRTDKRFNDKEIHEIWAFICYENEEYYLYLSF